MYGARHIGIAAAITWTCCLSIAVTLNAPASLNFRPIIGIPTQEMDNATMGAHYIAASYAKFVEQAGARVVPLHLDYDSATLNSLLDQINGVLIPGGHSVIDPETRIYKFSKQIVNYAIRANDNGDHFPVWGTCLGFELLATIMTDDSTILTRCSAENMAMSLEFTRQAPSSKLFRSAPSAVLEAFATRDITYNNHKFCITTKNFASHSLLPSLFNVLSTNIDPTGIEFVSTMEALQYPFFGIQWHAEKPQFEWNPTKGFDHSVAAVASMQYLANYFVNEARRNSHQFKTPELEFSALIYNDVPRLVHSYKMLDVFVQMYLWTKADARNRKVRGIEAMVAEGTRVSESA
eukprot:Opistho-2@75659